MAICLEFLSILQICFDHVWGVTGHWLVKSINKGKLLRERNHFQNANYNQSNQ